MSVTDKITNLENKLEDIQDLIKSINEELEPSDDEEFDESELEKIDNTSNKADAGSGK